MPRGLGDDEEDGEVEGGGGEEEEEEEEDIARLPSALQLVDEGGLTRTGLRTTKRDDTNEGVNAPTLDKDVARAIIVIKRSSRRRTRRAMF